MKDRIQFVALSALAAGLFFGTAFPGTGAFFSREPSGYYGLLTAGFREGHLYAKIDPKPALLALKDPYDPVANGPYRVHDMSLWRGKYYLYYGVIPVLVFFWPLAAATGWYPSENLAIATFCSIGFMTALGLFQAVRRRHFPSAPRWIIAAGAICLLLAVLPLTCASGFYEVPISCAFCCFMPMLGMLFLALHSSARSSWWLAGASLLFGLTVGSRPDYLLGAPALLVPAVWLWRQEGREKCNGRSLVRWTAVASVPAALCGFGLLLYNRLRFGSIFEFGWHYQLAGYSNRGERAFELRNFLPNVRDYLFGPGYWQRYFSFFVPPGGKPFGMVRYLPWTWLGLFAFLPPVLGSRRAWGPLIGAAWLAAAANFLLLSCFQVTLSRYMADYLPAFLLLGGVGALAVSSKLPRLRGGVAAAAVFSLLVLIAASTNPFPRQGLLFSVARTCDWPAYLWERASGRNLGALRLELQLPEDRIGLAEPVFETGPAADCRDWLGITYLSPNSARIGFFHAGLGWVQGREFAVPPSRRITVDASCGSLFPPFAHPVFRGWSRQAYENTIRDLWVTVDGAQVLRAALDAYPTPPQDLRIGWRGWPGSGISDRFSGKILSWTRLPLGRPAEIAAKIGAHTPIELSVVFPADRAAAKDPLLSTGDGQLSDLIYCTYEGAGRVRFALDHFDAWGPEGEPVAYDPTHAYRLTLWMGSLAGPDRSASEASIPLSGRVVVLMDGAVVLNGEAPFVRADPASARVGTNPFLSTIVRRRFSGLVLGIGQAANFSAMPLPRYAGKFGAVEMSVVFPLSALGSSEPVVVTGARGAGDLLYVRYIDSTHVCFGLDHWGTGGAIGVPVDVDYRFPHRLELTMGSLYENGAAGTWARRVRVRLDGTTVLDSTSDFFPSKADQILIGRNVIEGSTCGVAFTGRIIEVLRKPHPTE